MARRQAAIAIALLGSVLTASGAGAQTPPYTLAATQSCLAERPDAVVGLPPASPPVSPTLFVFALPRARRELGVWSGGKTYEGVVLSFFRTARDARASLQAVAALHGGQRVGNVVAVWDQRPARGRGFRKTVLSCLRSGAAGVAPGRPVPAATLATFAGSWGGHTRGLAIASDGHGRANVDDGCCTHVYDMTFRIVSVNGTLTRATAVYRVTSFRRYGTDVRSLRVGDTGRLVLRNGIVTNTLTNDYFCSDPAWGATGACGA